MDNLNQIEARIVRPSYVSTVSRNIDTFLHSPNARSQHYRALMPATDIVETDNSYYVNVDLPGIEPQDVEVIVDAGVLNITAEYKEDYGRKSEARLLRRERQIGTFSRSIRVGRDVDRENIEAQHRDGVLRITLPKSKESQARKVKVSAG